MINFEQFNHLHREKAKNTTQHTKLTRERHSVLVRTLSSFV